jgi:catechol 2,3-dioxygenase
MNFMTEPDESGVDDTRNRSKVRIGHLNLRVADLNRATDFYCNVLGMTVSCYGPDVGIPTVYLAFGDYHHDIALRWFYSTDPKSNYAVQRALDHFAITYPDELSLAKAVSKVLERGELIDDARDHGGFVSIYLRDPEGHQIELYCDRPRSRWFDAWGQLIVDSEPLDLKKWLTDAIARSAETSLQSTELCHLGAFR